MINLTNDRLKDFRAATEAAGYQFKPKNYTGLHHQDYGKMQLVDQKIHAITGRTGEFSIHK